MAPDDMVEDERDHSPSLARLPRVVHIEQVVADARLQDLADLRSRQVVPDLDLLGQQDGPLHRLWYDMRSQSMYEEAFRADVRDIDDALRAMIWRVVDRYSQLANQPPAVSPTAAYAIFDGLFQRALLRHLSGHTDALDELATEIRSLLPTLFRPA